MSYSLLAQTVFGRKGKIALDIMVALTQFTFAISFVSFISTAWKEATEAFFNFDGLEWDRWLYAILMMVICSGISLVRDITKFSPTFLFGNLMILANIVVVVIYLSIRVSKPKEEGGGWGTGYQAINTLEYWSMIGFSCYCYEGIGMILPIMNVCECPEKFDKIMLTAFIFLTTIYICFSDFCYIALGDEMTKPFVI